MSADRQRLVSAIRRMAKTDPDIRSAIDTAQSRGSQPASAGIGASDAESERQCCDGSVSGNTNPGVEQRDPSDGGQDASDGLGPDDPARLDMGAGALTGIKNCETDEPICFEGSDWIPPEGWDEPSAPPLDPTYDPGSYWVLEVATKLDDEVSYTSEYYYSAGRPSVCGYHLCGDGGPCGSDWDSYNQLCEAGAVAVGRAKMSCPAEYSDADIESACNTIPYEEAWPSDGCVNLAIKGGTLVGSKYDTDQDGSYSRPMAEIQLCDGNGNQIGLKPSASGGWKTIDAINGGDGYLYDAQGQQIARISGDEYSDPKV